MNKNKNISRYFHHLLKTHDKAFKLRFAFEVQVIIMVPEIPTSDMLTKILFLRARTLLLPFLIECDCPHCVGLPLMTSQNLQKWSSLGYDGSWKQDAYHILLLYYKVAIKMELTL